MYKRDLYIASWVAPDSVPLLFSYFLVTFRVSMCFSIGKRGYPAEPDIGKIFVCERVIVEDHMKGRRTIGGMIKDGDIPIILMDPPVDV